MTDLTLGQRIAERRKMLGLSQEAFGDKMSVSRQAISKWEADATTPEIEKLISMSKLFGVSVDWLLGTESGTSSDASNDLNAQIMMAFQPPQPIPTPAEDAVLEPPSESEASPTTDSPRIKWLPLTFLAVAVLSLIFSVSSLVQASKKPEKDMQSTASSDSEIAKLRNQLTELTAQITELENQIGELDKFTTNVAGINHNISSDVRSLQYELEVALARIDDLKAEADNNSSEGSGLSSYDSLSSWSLTGVARDDLAKVTLTLSAITTSKTSAAKFVAQRDGKEIVRANCTVDGRGYYAQLEVPVADGYQYLLILTHMDGTQERLTLSGHGLSNLSNQVSPRVTATQWEETFKVNNSERFWVGWKNIFLNRPRLAPEGAQFGWSDLRIGYYHNEGIVSESSLMDVLSDTNLTKSSLSFSSPTTAYHINLFQEGDVHELRLEGTLTINGQTSDFSLPLISWIVQDGAFTKIET